MSTDHDRWLSSPYDDEDTGFEDAVANEAWRIYNKPARAVEILAEHFRYHSDFDLYGEDDSIEETLAAILLVLREAYRPLHGLSDRDQEKNMAALKSIAAASLRVVEPIITEAAEIEVRSMADE